MCPETHIEALVVGVLRHGPAELALCVEQTVDVVGAPHLREEAQTHHRQYDPPLPELSLTARENCLSDTDLLISTFLQ